MTHAGNEADLKVVNIIKGLIMDGTRNADSGHPGGPMSSADFGYILFKEFLNFDPDDGDWFNRDRLVLSAGHESMLLYSLLALSGFMSIDDLKAFRQLNSRTPGHPEHELAPMVEATTGPLGQGFSMAVGMAVADSFLGAKLGKDIVDHYTYVIASDGDLQEPIALGSAALAGHWGLGKLIVLYDSNDIQLAGPTARADCTNYKELFEAKCWQVIEINGHDHEQIRNALRQGKKVTSKPTLIICKTVIAKGSATMEGDFNTHGAPLSPEEITATKKLMGLPENETFYLPQDAISHFQSRFSDLRDVASGWKDTFTKKKSENADFAGLWNKFMEDRSALTVQWPYFPLDKPLATRKAFGQCLDSLISQVENIMGGSADLDPSNQTVNFRETAGIFGKENPGGRSMSFGVREFPMGAILNGMALHGGIIPFGATFLVFSDYERNALRMSALQKLPVLHVFTHDSFYVGEDGPTHQPIEHISSLRLIPNMLLFRPADANESKYCLEIALQQTERPSTLVFTRQGLPVMDEQEFPGIYEGVRRGGYILKDCQGTPDILIIATGSEVSLALEAQNRIPEKNIRVISMPCVELFEEQDKSYKDEVLPPKVTKRVAVEAGRTELWHKYVGIDGCILGINHFGASAPGKVLAEKFGFTGNNLTKLIKDAYC